MFCPKCGQQQISEEMRFCSRCGFQLGEITALMASGGVSVASIAREMEIQKQLALKRRTRQGAKVMFASAVLFPLAMAFSIPLDSPFPLFLPFIVFVAGLAWFLYFRLFGEDSYPSVTRDEIKQIETPTPGYLPPAQAPATPIAGRATHRTAEIVQPSSVTEHTTKLLDEN